MIWELQHFDSNVFPFQHYYFVLCHNHRCGILVLCKIGAAGWFEQHSWPGVSFYVEPRHVFFLVDCIFSLRLVRSNYRCFFLGADVHRLDIQTVPRDFCERSVDLASLSRGGSFFVFVGFCWLFGFCWLLASVGFLAFGFCWLLASLGFLASVSFLASVGFLAFVGFWLLLTFWLVLFFLASVGCWLFGSVCFFLLAFWLCWLFDCWLFSISKNDKELYRNAGFRLALLLLFCWWWWWWWEQPGLHALQLWDIWYEILRRSLILFVLLFLVVCDIVPAL